MASNSISALEDIEETLLAESFTVASWDETSRVRDIDGVKREYVDGCAATDREVIADADLTVALDPPRRGIVDQPGVLPGTGLSRGHR